MKRVTTLSLWLLPAVVILAAFLCLGLPLIRSDGLAYYAWLHSLAHDGDMALENQHELLRGVVRYQLVRNEQTGRVSTPFPYGSALLWWPCYKLGLWVGHGEWYVRHIAPQIDEAAYLRLQGTGFLAGLSVALGTTVLALLTAYLTLDMVRRLVPLPTAALAVVLVFAASPFIYYATLEPTMAHVPGAFAVSLLCWLFLRYGRYTERSERERPWAWLLIGLALGLATVVRWQLVLVGLPLGLILVYQRRWRSLVTLVAGTLALAWTIPWSWQRMFGRALVVPMSPDDPGSFLQNPSNLLNVWFSTWHGLFNWSPILLLSLLGLALEARRQWQVALLFGMAFVMQSVLAASVVDWWAGWSFGMRRLTEFYPLYALGLAFLLRRVWGLRRQGRWPLFAAGLLRALCSLALVAALAWGLFLFVVYGSYSIRGNGTSADAIAFARRSTAAEWREVRARFRAWYGLPAWRRPPPWR